MFDLSRLLPRKLQIAWLRRKLRLEEAKLEAERKQLKFERQETLMGQIGIATTSWTFLEMSIDMVINLVHTRGNGQQAVQRDLPASLKTKLAYLRAIPRKIEALSHLSADLQNFVDKMQVLKDHRHDLTHGMLKVLEKKLDVEVIRFGYSGSKLTVNKKVISQIDIRDANHEMVVLNSDIAMIGMVTAQALGERDYQDAFRSLAVSAAFSVKVSNHLSASVNKV